MRWLFGPEADNEMVIWSRSWDLEGCTELGYPC